VCVCALLVLLNNSFISSTHYIQGVGLVSFLSQDEHPSLGGATFIDDEMLYAYRIATITGIIKSHHIYTVTGVLTLPA
jgi:hypothetical protein